jgi:Na+/H+ antiporter NhaD/arsenite permease-like protein
VSNIGGCLLPLGDPPLLLGFLRGVPFLWTLHLFPMYALAVALLLALYFAVDLFAYRHERSRDLQVDETDYVPIRLEGAGNLLLLGGVLLAVALLVPGQRIPLTPWAVPDLWLREIALLGLSALSYTLTPKRIHGENHFAFGPILEVAALFVGVFVTMQIPIEILRAKGAALGIATPMAFFWASGGLSSFLDNAPTYVVFFELAGSLPAAGQRLVPHVATATGSIPFADLLAISCASVFMGANTYIGNGPNFLVKSIAEHRGVKMPGFFGYMLYSGAILIPLFALVSLVFFR